MMTNEISFFLLIVHFCPLQRNMLYGIDIYFRKIDTKVRKYFRSTEVSIRSYVLYKCTLYFLEVRKYFRTKILSYESTKVLHSLPYFWKYFRTVHYYHRLYDTKVVFSVKD